MFHSATSTHAATAAGSNAAATTSATAANPVAGAITLLVLLLLVAAGITALVIWMRRRSREKARIAAMSPAEREHRDAQTEYRTRIAAAEKALGAATKERIALLKAADKALAQAQAAPGRAIASYHGRDGGVAFTTTALALPQGTFPLTASVTATVDTAGNLATSSRSTLTRIAAGGLLFGPVGAIVGGTARKTRLHDTRELYLLIQGDTFAAAVTCNPDDGPRVHQFAAALRNAALNANTARARDEQAIAQAQRTLTSVQQNTAPVDAARAQLQQASVDTARREAAAAALQLEQAARDERAADAAGAV